MADRVSRILRYIIVALAAMLVVLIFFFVSQYIALRRARIITMHELWASAFIRRHGTPTPQEAAFIGPWMTFGYVNEAFLLPPGYLEQRFSIADPRYPMLTLGTYAKESGISIPLFTSDVQNAVRSYLAAHAATSTIPAETVGPHVSGTAPDITPTVE